MAKFFAELLGCTLRDKGASPTFEVSAKDEEGGRLRPCVVCVCVSRRVGCCIAGQLTLHAARSLSSEGCCRELSQLQCVIH